MPRPPPCRAAIRGRPAPGWRSPPRRSSPGGAAAQQPAPPLQGAGGITARLVARWDVDRLSRVLTTDTPAFAGIPVATTPAGHAVRLHRVSDPSVVPERGNRPVVLTGLLALPEGGATRLPLVSSQHGTVHGRQQLPSFPEQSPETELMIAQFAGQGSALIGADHIGMGESREPQGDMVKACHQQATSDMVRWWTRRRSRRSCAPWWPSPISTRASSPPPPMAGRWRRTRPSAG